MKILLAIIPSLMILGVSLVAATQMRYELRDDALCVVMFGRCVRRVPYANIDSVRRGYALWNEHWNRISRDANITLRLKHGLIRNFVINPPDTENFVAQLQTRLKSTP